MLGETGAAAVMVAPWSPMVTLGCLPTPAASLRRARRGEAHGSPSVWLAFELHVRLLDATGAHLARARSLAGWYLLWDAKRRLLEKPRCRMWDARRVPLRDRCRLRTGGPGRVCDSAVQGAPWEERLHDSSVSAPLHLHLPFCARKCDYCDFASWTTSSGRPAHGGLSVGALKGSSARWPTSACSATARPLTVGGGTPTLLGTGLGELVRRVRGVAPVTELNLRGKSRLACR